MSNYTTQSRKKQHDFLHLAFFSVTDIMRYDTVSKKKRIRMMEQKQLRKLYQLFFEAGVTKDLPNIKEKNKAANKFYEFMEQVKENPALLDDDAELNAYLVDYLDEYAFSAFGVGFALGKSIETEIVPFTNHLILAEPID